MNAPRLRADAEAIWTAGVRAVDSERLVEAAVGRAGEWLTICGMSLPVADIGRLAVVGAGKAGAGMAAAIERAVGPELHAKLCGWVNVPADCVRELERIHVHAARPAGVNEPTREGVEGAERILELVGELGPRDVCVVLLSGGGSALLPAPVEGVSLEDKQAVTRLLMHSGATIDELNCVRKHLSRVKGGGLARACRAGRTIALIISDVIGDPLETIASGPTTADSTTALDALRVLQKYGQGGEVPASVWAYLRAHAGQAEDRGVPATVSNHLTGTNRVALEAAAAEAHRRGYTVRSLGSDNAGEAQACGRELAELCLRVRDEHRPLAPPACLLSGGEPVVQLAQTDQPRKGGRNQELALAALQRLWHDGAEGLVVLSGGTDGEDGPTDAAGAVVDAEVLRAAQTAGLSPDEFLAINNSYPFFDQTGGLLKTGPTHTNVMDLRVALVASK
ncbi:MAG: DUF4147 domain-containing protein [Planctomycetes bacterium]|nr:DUF4147 domain-containing protein [Planctomycetota bacterium]